MISARVGVSIFFPCYNDAKSIRKLVENAFSTIKKYTKRYEVIVVNDASTDNSQIVLKKLAQKYKRLRLISHPQNLGYGGALRSGFQAARYQLIFYTDGDGQYDVRELPLLLSLITKDCDFINGIKMTRHDPTYRVVIGNLYSFMTRWLFWIPIYDIDCDFRLIKKSLLEKIDLKSSSGSICIELVKKAQRVGAKFRQVSVHHLERRFGVSQFFRLDRILLTFGELTKLWIQLMIIDKLLKKALQMPKQSNYNPEYAKAKQITSYQAS